MPLASNILRSLSSVLDSPLATLLLVSIKGIHIGTDGQKSKGRLHVQKEITLPNSMTKKDKIIQPRMQPHTEDSNRTMPRIFVILGTREFLMSKCCQVVPQQVVIVDDISFMNLRAQEAKNNSSMGSGKQ